MIYFSSFDYQACLISFLFFYTRTQKPRLTRTAVPSFLTKREQSDVKKVPKGVPLQFDINSVGKQVNFFFLISLGHSLRVFLKSV